MPPCAIDFTSRFTADVRAFSADHRGEIEAALGRLSTAFGQPHLRSGLGIRRLQRNYFECRVGRDLRMVFKLEGSILTMARIGNHEEVRKFLKGI
jgi:mRNA-degrading endonuclease YafQ of YafQ-DinJ toxin-antitoxin module